MKKNPQNYRTYATARSHFYYAFVVVILIVVFYFFVQDLNGVGLIQSTYFRVLGYLIYPIFYVSAGVGLFTILRLIRNLDNVIAINKEHSLLKFFGTEIPFSDVVSIGVERFPFKMGRALVIRRTNGSPLRLGALILREDIGQVVEALKMELQLN